MSPADEARAKKLEADMAKATDSAKMMDIWRELYALRNPSQGK